MAGEAVRTSYFIDWLMGDGSQTSSVNYMRIYNCPSNSTSYFDATPPMLWPGCFHYHCHVKQAWLRLMLKTFLSIQYCVCSNTQVYLSNWLTASWYIFYTKHILSELSYLGPVLDFCAHTSVYIPKVTNRFHVFKTYISIYISYSKMYTPTVPIFYVDAVTSVFYCWHWVSIGRR